MVARRGQQGAGAGDRGAMLGSETKHILHKTLNFCVESQ
jgi:hypothetical protein